MEVFVGFRPYHVKLGPQDIKGRIGLIIIENEQELLGYRGQFAFGAPSRFPPARTGFDPSFIRFLLCALVEVTEDGQQLVELGLGQAG